MLLGYLIRILCRAVAEPMLVQSLPEWQLATIHVYRVAVSYNQNVDPSTTMPEPDPF